MKKSKKTNLDEAIKRVNNTPDRLFGEVEIDITTLPCLSKPKKEKITANFDSDLIGAIRKFAKKNKVSYTTLMNDVLRKIFLRNT